MGLLIWLVLSVAYGVSVLLLIRQERYGLPRQEGRTRSSLLVFRHRGLLARKPDLKPDATIIGLGSDFDPPPAGVWRSTRLAYRLARRSNSDV